MIQCDHLFGLFVRAAKTDWTAATAQTKDQRNQVIQDTVLSYAELSKWEKLVAHLQEEMDEPMAAEIWSRSEAEASNDTASGRD